jgi:hypothetical protein
MENTKHTCLATDMTLPMDGTLLVVGRAAGSTAGTFVETPSSFSPFVFVNSTDSLSTLLRRREGRALNGFLIGEVPVLMLMVTIFWQHSS